MFKKRKTAASSIYDCTVEDVELRYIFLAINIKVIKMYFVHHVARLLVTRTILYAYACYQAQPLQHFITVSLALVLHVRTSYGYVPPS